MEEPGLKDTEEFAENVEQNKSTIHFKIGLCKFSKKNVYLSKTLRYLPTISKQYAKIVKHYFYRL